MKWWRRMVDTLDRANTRNTGVVFDITQAVIALAMVGIIGWQIVHNQPVPDAVYAILTAIIGFYFGTKVGGK